jgi:hypothetical protein
MKTNHPLLLAIGVSEIPPGQTEDALVKRALQDNYFFNRVLNRLVENAALDVAQSIPRLEREALRDRLVPPSQRPIIEWSLITPDQNIQGVMTIVARCGQETVRWNGAAKNVRPFRFHGEAVPLDIVFLYEQHHGTPIDPDAGLSRREKIADAQYRQDQQNKTLSTEEILVLEQFGKFPK